MSLKSLVKAVLPRSVAAGVGRWRMERRERRMASLDVEAAFDEVYRKRMWKQGAALSGLGSSGSWADEYVALVRGFIEERGVRFVIDAGCGDFEIGSRLAPLVERYLGIDISSTIIEQNRVTYSDSANVTFMHGNLLDVELPRADLITVRQVFQHLTNAQIEQALANLERARPRYIIVAEEIAGPDRFKLPNLDMASHSIRTRADFGSGIVLSEPPFSRAVEASRTISPDRDGTGEGSVLAIYTLSPS